MLAIIPVKKRITIRLPNKGWKASSEKLKRGL